MKMIKVSRGQYNVLDTHGNKKFEYPTSKHECNLFIMGEKMTAKILKDERIIKIATNYLSGVPVNQYGDIEQWIYGHVYKLYHNEIRAFIKRPSLFLEHVEATEKRNKAARLESLQEQPPLLDILKLTRSQLNVIEEALMFYRMSYRERTDVDQTYIDRNVSRIKDVENLIFDQIDNT